MEEKKTSSWWMVPILIVLLPVSTVVAFAVLLGGLWLETTITESLHFVHDPYFWAIAAIVVVLFLIGKNQSK